MVLTISYEDMTHCHSKTTQKVCVSIEINWNKYQRTGIKPGISTPIQRTRSKHGISIPTIKERANTTMQLPA